MNSLALREFHSELGAQFSQVNGMEAVLHYGDWLAEHAALRGAVGVIDLGFRSRICLLGSDRVRFLNGQVTNNVADLKTGTGCYAALVTAKGKMLSDLNVFSLEEEILLDFEPGLSTAVSERLDKFIIADDVQLVDVAPHYGLFSIQGPRSAAVIDRMALTARPPEGAMTFVKCGDASLGDIYLMNMPRSASAGFDLFVPTASLGVVWDKLVQAARESVGRACGWQALEAARIEAGIPRFGADMNETNLPPEAAIESRAISYSKGCYIGQEIIARLRTYGQVAKALRGLRLSDGLTELPARGTKLFKGGKEVGYLTSALDSPVCGKIALGYVRRETNQVGTELQLSPESGGGTALVVPLPFAITQ